MINKNIYLLLTSFIFSPTFAIDANLYNKNRHNINSQILFSDFKDELPHELYPLIEEFDIMFYSELISIKDSSFNNKLFEKYNKAYQENTNLELINKYKEIYDKYKDYNAFYIDELNLIKKLAENLASEINDQKKKLLEIKLQVIKNPSVVEYFVSYYLERSLLTYMEKAYYATYNAAPPHKFAERARGAAALFANESKADKARELRKKANEAYKKADKAYNLYKAADKSHMKAFYDKDAFFELRKKYYEAEDLARKLDEEADNAFNLISATSKIN